MAELYQTLAELDPDLTVLSGDEIGERYSSDWTFTAHCPPSAVVRPTTTNAVAELMRYCHQHRQPVVVQGGLTGLAGGATPQPGEISLSLERLQGIEEIDPVTMTMTVKAGTPLQTIQEAALQQGLIFPMDLGARGTATIGGNVSTNAGGVQVIRYGMTRALVMGLEVVLPDGTIISSMNKMLKNNAGYDLKHLFIGAEGTLGIVTRVVLRLFPKPQSCCTALLAFTQFNDALAVLGQAQARMNNLLNSFEVMWSSYFEQVAPTVSTFTNPFDERHAAYAILEIRGNDQQRDLELFEEFLAEQMQQGNIADVVLAQSDSQAANLWSLRHGIGDFTKIAEPCINYDVSIPIGSMDAYTRELEADMAARYPHLAVVQFGHIGDSNLHVVIGKHTAAEFSPLKDYVHELTSRYQGSISAEHGVGQLKRDYLHFSRSDEEIALMRLLKNTLDPHGILNNGRVIPH